MSRTERSDFDHAPPPGDQNRSQQHDAQADALDLSIIIVSWNVWDLLRACLKAIEEQSRGDPALPQARRFGPGRQANGTRPADRLAHHPAAHPEATLEVVVVDNASDDATADLLPARFPWVRLIRSADNLGFTGGNNVGYAASLGRTVYFLNPDTEVLRHPQHGDSLWTLYAALQENCSLGVVGPQLRYGDNSLQSNRRRFPTPVTGFWESTWLGRQWPDNPWRRRYHMADWPTAMGHDVDWMMGAAIMARREALEAVRMPQYVGPFDEGFFMYCEEMDLCRRIKTAGWRIAYLPEAVVIHYGGRSADQVSTRRFILANSSKIRYYRKHFGPLWAGLLRAFLLWEFVLQLLLESGKWLLGHKRPLRAERIAAYRAVLANGLRATPRPSAAPPPHAT